MVVFVGKNYKIEPYKYPDGRCWQVTKRAMNSKKNNMWQNSSTYFAKIEHAFEWILREETRNREDDVVIENFDEMEKLIEKIDLLYDEYSKSLASQVNDTTVD